MGFSSKTVVSPGAHLTEPALEALISGNTDPVSPPPGQQGRHASHPTVMLPLPLQTTQCGLPRQLLFQEGLDYPEAGPRDMEKTGGTNRDHHPGCQGKGASHQSKDPGGVRKISPPRFLSDLHEHLDDLGLWPRSREQVREVCPTRCQGIRTP